MEINNYIKNIFRIKNETDFNEYALKLYLYQSQHNPIYKKYLKLIKHKTPIKTYQKIPFLPIEFFKTKNIITSGKTPKITFLSSGTTTSIRAKHLVVDINIYKKSILNCFKLFFGNIKKYTILCLVPEFEDNQNSSLAFMCQELIQKSNKKSSGVFIKKYVKLKNTIQELERKKETYILFGLSMEILEFSKYCNIKLEYGTIIETGGNKRNTRKIIKEQLHQELKSNFNTQNICSEYGMAELLSQSYYLHHNNGFQSPPWKKILIRDKTNPFKIIQDGKRGYINIIDLANIYSCGFIATNDLGDTQKSRFNILGRAQNATERGCNLMI